MKYKIEERIQTLYNYSCDKRIWVIKRKVKILFWEFWEDFKLFYNRTDAEKSLEKLNQSK